LFYSSVAGAAASVSEPLFLLLLELLSTASGVTASVAGATAFQLLLSRF
jgi:hypothetical protein